MYVILYSDSADGLAKLVSDNIKIGFAPIGSLIIQYGMKGGNIYVNGFLQPMVKF